MEKYHFIINFSAGSGNAKKKWEWIKKALQEKQIVYDVHPTAYKGHGEELAKEIATHIQTSQLVQSEAIVVVGGDGTLHEIMNGLTEFTNIQVGYIPAGSGNDFARGHKLPLSTPKTLAHLLQTKENGSIVDVGMFHVAKKNESRQFVNNIGLGFDAEIVKYANHSTMKVLLNKLHIGFLVYVFSLFTVFFKFRPFSVTVSVDGEIHTYDDALFVTVSNHAYFGGGVKILPNAVPTDGKFDVCVARKVSFTKLLFLFMAMKFEKHTSFREVNIFQGEHIGLQTTFPVEMHADGERVGKTKVSLDMQPQKRSFLL